MLCTIKAPKRVALNLFLTKKQVLVAPGDSQQVDLSGDEIGVVEHTITQVHRDNQVPTNEYGSITCPEREASDAKPPVNSKKHRANFPDEYVDGVHKSERKAKKTDEAAKAK